MSRDGMPSMTALLALLAVAGFQNRDKIAEIFGNLTGHNREALPDQGTADTQVTGSSGGGGLGDLLGGLFGGAAVGGAASQSGGLGGILGELGSMLGGGQPDQVADASRNPQDTLNRGMGDLIDHFRQKGLAEEADSWVSDGPSKPVQPSQIENTLDPQVIDTLARQLGMSRQELLERLAQNLPTAVSQLKSGF